LSGDAASLGGISFFLLRTVLFCPIAVNDKDDIDLDYLSYSGEEK